jgi:hypothetical protein
MPWGYPPASVDENENGNIYQQDNTENYWWYPAVFNIHVNKKWYEYGHQQRAEGQCV